MVDQESGIYWRPQGRVLLLASAWLMAANGAVAQSGGGLWTSAGQDLGNTRHQATESKISPSTVGSLSVKWVFSTGGDVSATPAVDGNTVYFPDWVNPFDPTEGGKLYALDRRTGAARWIVSIAAASGVPGDKARATPVIAKGKVIVGTQGPFGYGGKMLAFDKDTGALVWSTVLDSHPAAIVTQSATVQDGRLFVGVASQEEALAALLPGYVCCTFRGSMLALDVDTGAILWKTYMAPDGFSGNAIWGSAPAVDPKRGQVYIATGNNYSVPQDVLDCVGAAGEDPGAKAACLPADNHFDSIVALDAATGAIRWATRAVPYDAWTLDCIPFIGDGSNCPQPAGPAYDFGQAPALFKVRVSGKMQDVVGAGQKSGQYWAVNPETGLVLWVTQAGPGGTAGGLQWGSAVDGERVYTANANYNRSAWTLPDGSTTDQGVWSALDAATGEILWQTAPPSNPSDPFFASASGPATVANGVMFGCTLDSSGYMYALDAATGEMLWSFASGGSCLSGAAISRGDVFWGSGYSNFGFGTANNKLYAFTVP